MTTSTTQTDLIVFLTGQHREVDGMFSRLEKLDGNNSDEARTLAERVVISLVEHSVSEEIYLYPTTREHVPGGNEIADHEVSEHAEVEDTMTKLESLEPDDAGFWPTVHELISSVRHHVQEEENDLFPKLRAACSKQALQDLGNKAEQVQKIAPTRPHPSSPSEGGALAAVVPGAGMVDRVRDALSGRGS